MADLEPAPPPQTTGEAGGREDDATRIVELYLLRHADAGDPAAWPRDDAARPLSGKGRRQADAVGRWLAGLGRRPQVILTSPKVRAEQTATAVARRLSLRSIVDDALAEELTTEVVEALVERHADEATRLLLVGHDPDFSDLASELTSSRLTLRKGAVARIDVGRPIEAGSGVLRWLIPPDALPGMRSKGGSGKG